MLADNVKEVKLLLGIVETVKRTVKNAKIRKIDNPDRKT